MKNIAFLLATGVCAAQLAYAEETVLEDVVISGSYFNDYKVDDAKGAMRSYVSLLDTPQSVAVIPETLINEQLATTLGEVLNNDASLTAGSKQRNREVFNLRGFQLSSSTGYLRDGHQHWSHYQQPIETLEAVEIIKGPSSILYGQSGPGGLVNMVTKKPSAYRILNVSADVDQAGSSRLMLDAGGAITDDNKLRYRSVLVKQKEIYSREYQNGESRERDRLLGSFIADYTISDNALLSIHYDRTNDKAGLDTGAWLDSSGNVIGNDKTIRDMSWAFTDITVENIGADLDLRLSESWDLTLGYNEQFFSRQRFESSAKKTSDYKEGDSYTMNPYDRYDDWKFKTAFVDINGDFDIAGMNHQLLVGINHLDYSYAQKKTKADSFTYVPGTNEVSRPDISYKTDDTVYKSEYRYYGVYAQDLVTLSDQWKVSLGGRFDKQTKKNADNESLLPKAAVLYSPTNQSTLYASYSESFEPQSSEKLMDEDDINNGMRLEAVTAKQIELGSKWQLMNERLLVTAALFDINKTGALITENITDTQFKTRTTQAGNQRHKGFEIAAQGAVTDKLFIMTSAMHIDAIYEKDERYENKRPVDVADWSANIWSRYELTNQLAFNAGIFYEDDRFADGDNTITKDGYSRVDAGASYKMKFKE
jgi:iron complex outermembrane receptor protein